MSNLRKWIFDRDELELITEVWVIEFSYKNKMYKMNAYTVLDKTTHLVTNESYRLSNTLFQAKGILGKNETIDEHLKEKGVKFIHDSSSSIRVKQLYKEILDEYSNANITLFEFNNMFLRGSFTTPERTYSFERVLGEGLMINLGISSSLKAL